MTLFKKVFQSEARPANASEAIDEDALRAAFHEAHGDVRPFVLDPFEHSVTDDDATAEPSECPDDITDDFPEEELDSPEQSYELIKDDVDPSELSRDMEDREPAQPEVAAYLEKPDANLVADTDAQIADFMTRALKADPQEGPQPEAPDVQASDYDGDAQEDDEALVHGEVADAEETPNAAEQEETNELDLSEFALAQLSGVEAKSDVPVDGDIDAKPEEASSPDLSAGNTPSVSDDFNAMPDPAVGRSGRRAGRVKTRLLGFSRDVDAEADPFGQTPANTATAQREKFPVGWLVIVEGPGEGHAFSIFNGASVIGRGEDQMIRLDFGDNTISRNNHAAIAYDEEANKFYIGHGGKSNIIRRNARPVLSTEEMNHADLLRIGETTLKFVALCGPDFQWNGPGGSHATGV